ncbi:L,D-transpeptidase family protein [Methylocapsa aurea]|uniref:L,D-transpeptidase family protein n=1 Tax=Methylocapsa aurea TaxID=663610 RepID=UPI00056439FF|nr:murein L,D-transpeptidase family protein [Methylocapsa aurea]
MDLRSKIAVWRAVGCLAALLLSQGSAPALAQSDKSGAPIPAATLALMKARETTAAAPILIRSYKKEAELEIWKKAKNGRFVLLKAFPICRWSGQLGPKSKAGDRQTPEGFYSVGPKQMNPNSAYYLSFDTGYPNAYDRAHGGSGSYLMVHGTCSSAGCYAMTDKGVGEIYALARDALRGGQPAFQFQAYPFRMTAQNMAKYRSDPNIAFWRQLKEGSDRFEATGEELVVGVAAGRYVFAASADPEKEALAAARRDEEEARVAALIADGGAAVRTTYADGGQHPAFLELARQGAFLGEVSRPEALAYAGLDVIVTPARPKRRSPATASLAPNAAKDATPLEAAAPQPAAAASSSAAELSAFAPAPMCYPLGRPTPKVQSLMAGAMPILPATFID